MQSTRSQAVTETTFWRTFSSLGKLPPVFTAQASQQESPSSCSVIPKC